MIYPEHIQWIIDNRGENLNQALSRDDSYKTIDNPLDVFLDADPTSKKKLTQWLVDTYISGGFRWEDIQSGSNSKAFDTLSLYVKHKSKLDSDNHIGQYNTLGSVYKDISPFIKSDKSSRSVKRDDQARAYEESDILVNSDALTVVIPKTEYASKWWGRGTQWCTAGDKNNMFYGYYKDGPLIIIIINGIKTQLFVNLVSKYSSVQFMDEHDNTVQKDFIEDNWSLLSPIIEWVVRQEGNILEYVPEALRIKELCLEAVKQNGMALYYVPEDLRTAELCLEAVRQDGQALSSVPKPLRIEKLCLEAVKQNSMALEYVPEALRTVEIYLEAVKQNGNAFYYVPENLKTAELCMEAIIQNGESLHYVPESLRTAELCLEAVRQNGRSLYHVPESLKTEELCLIAVTNDNIALRLVPEHLRTPEICLVAVRQSGSSLRYIPKYLITSELYREILAKDGYDLRYIPEALITADLCLEAVKQNSDALYYVPERLRTEELSLEAAKQEEEHKKKFSIPFEMLWDSNIIDEFKLELENGNKLKLNNDALY